LTARRRFTVVLAAIVGAATIAIVVSQVARRAEEAPADAGSDDGRRHAGAHLVAFRHAGVVVEPLDEDAVVRFGDVIRLRYHAGGKPHGVIISLDGAGAVTLHFPPAEDAPTSLAETASLPPYVIDGAPRFERFFFLTAEAPIDVKRVMAVLGAFARRAESAGARPALPDGVLQWSLRFRKPGDDGSSAAR
jgi:hypothetical protein